MKKAATLLQRLLYFGGVDGTLRQTKKIVDFIGLFAVHSTKICYHSCYHVQLCRRNEL
jgi:hypothetical protein